MNRIERIRETLDVNKGRSAWERGVTEYAHMLLSNFEENFEPEEEITEEKLLGGAENWRHFSYGGCALVYDGDIAETLATPSLLKRTDGGKRQPNKYATWLDWQTQALKQASAKLIKIAKTL